MNPNDALVQRVQRHARVATLLRPESPSGLPGPMARTSADVLGSDAVPVFAAAMNRIPHRQGAEKLSSSATAVPPIIQTPAEARSEEGIPDADWKRLQTIFNHHQAKQAYGATTATPESHRQPPARVQLDPHLESDPPREAVATTEANATPTERSQQRDTALHKTVESSKRRGIETQSFLKEDAITAQPLEAVWPVETVARQEPSVKPPDVARQAEPHPPPPQPDAYDDTALREKLRHVTAQMSSDSAVELIPPRRPRPSGRRVAAQAVQRQLVPEAVQTPGPAAQEPMATIETEIGPLPADLWDILGEEPPRVAAANQPETATSLKPGVITEDRSDAALNTARERTELLLKNKRVAAKSPTTAPLQAQRDYQLDVAVAEPAVHGPHISEQTPITPPGALKTAVVSEPGTPTLSDAEPTAIQTHPVAVFPDQSLASAAVQGQLPTPLAAKEPEPCVPAAEQADEPAAVSAITPDEPSESPAVSRNPFAVLAKDSPKAAIPVVARHPGRVVGEGDIEVTAVSPQQKVVQRTGELRPISSAMPAVASSLVRPQGETTLPLTPTVQRAAEQADMANASPTPTLENEQEVDETETAEVDLDELARRVYSDLKRRLVREWERARGRQVR